MRIYLDNAATSWPKRPAVVEAVTRAIEIGASYGRGHSRAADEVRRTVDRCRSHIAKLFGIRDPTRVVFTSGGTDGLNQVLGGYLRPGDRVVTTAMEHNSVLRPLHSLQQQLGLSVDVIPADREGYTDVDAFANACRVPTRLAIVTHASNVTGAVQDIPDLFHAARNGGAITVLDACQTAGHIAVNGQECLADVIVSSGHKGLGGPLGTGVVAFADTLTELPRPTRVGGTGQRSESLEQPDELPERFEAGSLNVPGIFGLEAAVRDLALPKLNLSWIDQLAKIPNVRRYGPSSSANRIGVASVTIEGWSPQDLASVLESEFGIECRAGLHCSPHAHATIGTLATGGTLRVSPPDHDEHQQAWLSAIEEIAASH